MFIQLFMEFNLTVSLHIIKCSLSKHTTYICTTTIYTTIYYSFCSLRPHSFIFRKYHKVIQGFGKWRKRCQMYIFDIKHTLTGSNVLLTSYSLALCKINGFPLYCAALHQMMLLKSLRSYSKENWVLHNKGISLWKGVSPITLWRSS